MIKLLLLALGTAALTASATAAVTQKTLNQKSKIEPRHEEPQNTVVKNVDEPTAKEYYMDYMFV